MQRKIPELIRELFKLSSAADSKTLKDKAMSFVRNGLIKAESVQVTHRKQWFITDKQGETLLFNALLLSAFFPDPKQVKEIFKNTDARLRAAETIRSIFLDRQSLLGISLVKPKTFHLIDNLSNDAFELNSTKLPNPFETLPQLTLCNNTALLHALLAQSASLDAYDSLLRAYLQQNWESAIEQCNQLENLGLVPSHCLMLVEAIKKEYREAREFDALLDMFKEKKFH